jgi:hypothetical protein
MTLVRHLAFGRILDLPVGAFVYDLNIAEMLKND